MISVQMSVSADRSDLQGLRDLSDLLTRFGIPGETLLASGADGHVGDPATRIGGEGSDLAGLRSFLAEHEHLPGDTSVSGDTVTVSLDVYGTDIIACGEHAGQCPDNVLVTVNPACRGCVG
jgi:hypothetical protein